MCPYYWSDAFTSIPILLALTFLQRADITIEYYVYVHTSRFQDIVIGLYNGYKVILQVVAMVLAFLTRKVKVKGLDDSKFIAAIVYITSIILAILIVSEYTINEFVDAYTVIFSMGILTDSTCILGLVFIPKVSCQESTNYYPLPLLLATSWCTFCHRSSLYIPTLLQSVQIQVKMLSRKNYCKSCTDISCNKCQLLVHQ